MSGHMDPEEHAMLRAAERPTEGRISALESRLAEAERQVEHYQQIVAKYAAKEAGLRDDLRSANERLAASVAALHGLLSYFDDPEQAEKYDEQERLDAARQALSASGAEVVKGWWSPITRNILKQQIDGNERPCFLVTLKETKHEEG